VIRIGIRNGEELHAAFDTVMLNARKAGEHVRICGVLVQPMIPPGVELMVGARIDPHLGPLILVSLGGVFVDLLKDASLELAPVTAAEARGMLERLKGAALLRGFRGSEPVDIEHVCDLIGRLSELAADHRERIVELDVNPLICSGHRIVAVDALLVRRRVKN
jgi:hypothetical protein